MGLLDLFRKKLDIPYLYSKSYQSLEMRYGESVGEVEGTWSLLYNLKEYSGQRADAFERLCHKNIELFLAIRAEGIKHNMPPITICDGYKRLAMLYEKRKDYLRAYKICREAIANGVEDEYGGSGKNGMITRAVRYGKKAGIALPEK